MSFSVNFHWSVVAFALNLDKFALKCYNQDCFEEIMQKVKLTFKMNSFSCLSVLRKISTTQSKAAFTRQTNVGQLVLAISSWCVWTTQQHVGKLLATNRTCLYSSQQFANMLLCRSHTPIWVCQHELANTSLTCKGRLTEVRNSIHAQQNVNANDICLNISTWWITYLYKKYNEPSTFNTANATSIFRRSCQNTQKTAEREFMLWWATFVFDLTSEL